MKYDDASWHSGGNFPEDSPIEYGGTHIALFLKWCFIQGWAGDIHLEEEPEDTRRVIDGSLSATEFFFRYCDGKLTNEDFNDEGNRFAESYYGDDGLYLADYAELFERLMYVSDEKNHDFELLAERMESRRLSRVLENSHVPAKKPWWKIW